MTYAASARDIEFIGGTTGVFPLTWGQRWMWDEANAMTPDHAHLNLTVVLEVPPTGTSEDVFAALRTLIEQREALRTTYRTAPDGRPEQVLVANGRLATELRESHAEDTRQTAYGLAKDLQRVPFGLAELPLRAGLVTADGTPRHLVLCIFHMATDGWDLAALRADLAALLHSGGGLLADLAPRRRQPREQSAWERGAQARQLSERSMRHWQRQLDLMPAMFPAPAHDAETPRFADVCMLSPALSLALPALAERLGTSQSTVYLALVAALLGRRTDGAACGLTITCRNRVTREELAAGGTFVQDVPVVIDLGGGTLREIAQHTWGALVPAYAASAYNPVEASSVAAAPGRPNLSCTANVEIDVKAVDAGALERLTESGRAGEFRSAARFFRTPGREHDRPGRKFYLAANASAGNVYTKIVADTTVLPTQAVVDFLSDLEQLAVLALADHDLDPLRVPLPRQWVLAADPLPQASGGAVHQVVHNGSEQYLVQSLDQALTDGWWPEGTVGTEEECIAHLANIMGMRVVEVHRAMDRQPVH